MYKVYVYYRDYKFKPQVAISTFNNGDEEEMHDFVVYQNMLGCQVKVERV